MISKYKLIVARSASKFILKQDKPTQKRIAQALEGLKKVPPEGDIKRMQGPSGMFRLRVGSYRILYEIDHSEKIIYIQAAGNRGDVYK